MSAGDRFLEREGATLRWRLEGAGPALVLLHGWALDLGYWDAVAPLLARRFTVLRFDRCGFGLSGGVPDIHRNVDDLQALLDTAEMSRPALLGMSQGARLALHYTLRNPAAVSALLLDGAPELESESELPIAQYRKLLDDDSAVAMQSEILAHPLMQLHTQDLESRCILVETVARYRGLDLAHKIRRGRAPDLHDIETPTLIINGALDSEARREAGRRLQAIIPHAQRIELQAAGHLAALDVPAQYAGLVCRYCDNVSA
jgi:3-oxoadipate enol-lactonase